MELVKLCPACGEENPVSEIVCRVCMTNVSSVPPSPAGCAHSGDLRPDENDAGQAELGGERTVLAPAALTLARLSDGRVLLVGDGCVLGRDGESGGFFKDDMTVSRRHARIDAIDGTWRIEDLGSMNGTWLNGKRLERGRPYPLGAGDTVALSLACEMRVIE
ncbi:MAG: FHA domain-containing protein [Synergistaceae bacterium]|jgi:pSer/pThr/pTyr-binding forkhead associated (FHA) protein|nr:FHA domain-containing protein [Synergistaceae bacterium]